MIFKATIILDFNSELCCLSITYPSISLPVPCLSLCLPVSALSLFSMHHICPFVCLYRTCLFHFVCPNHLCIIPVSLLPCIISVPLYACIIPVPFFCAYHAVVLFTCIISVHLFACIMPVALFACIIFVPLFDCVISVSLFACIIMSLQFACIMPVYLFACIISVPLFACRMDHTNRPSSVSCHSRRCHFLVPITLFEHSPEFRFCTIVIVRFIDRESSRSMLLPGSMMS